MFPVSLPTSIVSQILDYAWGDAKYVPYKGGTAPYDLCKNSKERSTRSWWIINGVNNGYIEEGQLEIEYCGYAIWFSDAAKCGKCFEMEMRDGYFHF